MKLSLKSPECMCSIESFRDDGIICACRLQFCLNDEQMKMSSFLCSGIWHSPSACASGVGWVWFIWGTYRMQKKMKAGSDSVQRISNLHATTSNRKQHISHISYFKNLQNSSAAGRPEAYKTTKSLLPQAARNNWRATTIQTNSCQYGKWGRRWDSHSAAEWGDFGQGKNEFFVHAKSSQGCFVLSCKIKNIMWLMCFRLGKSSVRSPGIRDAGHGRWPAGWCLAAAGRFGCSMLAASPCTRPGVLGSPKQSWG